MSEYSLGSASIAELSGVHPLLRNVVERAINRTSVDFGVHEGVRSIETQREYYRTGVSKTMDSMHLVQVDGFSHAVDLVPYVAGRLRWEWKPIYSIAAAVIVSANELGVRLTWGGVWDREVRLLPIEESAIEREVKAYSDRHPGPDFLDGPHWQLVGVK